MKTLQQRRREREREAAAKRREKKPSATSPLALLELGAILLTGVRAVGQVMDRADVSLNTLDALGITAAEARARHAKHAALEASYRRAAPPAPPPPVGFFARSGEVTFRVGLLTDNERTAYEARMAEAAL